MIHTFPKEHLKYAERRDPLLVETVESHMQLLYYRVVITTYRSCQGGAEVSLRLITLSAAIIVRKDHHLFNTFTRSFQQFLDFYLQNLTIRALTRFPNKQLPNRCHGVKNKGGAKRTARPFSTLCFSLLRSVAALLSFSQPPVRVYCRVVMVTLYICESQ